ncbi:MAG: hypothetical protein WC551_11320 [Patescibacteria group bacterium]
MEDFLRNADLFLAWIVANLGTFTTIALAVAGAYFAIKARREAAAKRILMDGLDPARNDNVAGAVVVESQRAGAIHPADVARITLGALRERAKSKRSKAIDREAQRRAKVKG